MLFSVWHGPVVGCTAEVYGRGMVPGWVYGVGIRVGYTGVYYPATQHRARSHPDSEAGPGGPCRGLEWVVRVVDACPWRRWAGTGISPPLRGPVGPPGPSLGYTLAGAHLAAYGDISVIFQ